MGNVIVVIIWVVVMFIAAIVKKAKQQQEMQARESTAKGTAASTPVYTAPEEDVRSFLEEIGARPKPIPQPEPPVQEQPAQSLPPQQPKRQHERSSWDEWQDKLVEEKVRRKQARSSRSAPAKALPKPKPTPSSSVWDEVDAVSVPVLSEETDPVEILAPRLSPVQRAVIWREILDTPPGLRAGGHSSVLG